MYALCCCCLELPCLKSLWSEYVWMGQSEIYGHMLKECFNLTWTQYDQSKDQICEVCITQLRSALQFKQRVLQSKTRLKAKLVDLEMPVKVERSETIEPAADKTEKNTFCAHTELWIPDEKNIDLLVDNVDDDHYDDADYKDGVNDDTHYIKTEQLDVQCGCLADVNEQYRDTEKTVQEAIFNNNRNAKGLQNSEETQNVDIINDDEKSIMIKEYTSPEQENIPTSDCKDSFENTNKTETSDVVSDSTINNANEAINPKYKNTDEDENTHPTSIKDENGFDESSRPSGTRRLTKSRCQVKHNTIMPINAHITERERCKIVLLREHGRSIADIARLMGVARNTVYRWIRRWENEGNLNEAKRTGRPRKTSLPQDSNIVHQFRENPFCQTRNVATSHNVSLITVRRRLREAGMMSRLQTRKRRLTDSKK